MTNPASCHSRYACHAAALLLLVCSLTLSDAQTLNPLEGNGRAIVAGGSLFRAQCATCHGADARGISSIDAPDLTLMWAERQRTTREVFDIIRDGIPGSIMPAHGLTDTELWMLVAFLQDAAVTGVMNLPPGDAGRGETLFAGHCAECHRVRGEGGVLGPDLSGITKRRLLDSISGSVRNPGAQVPRGYKPVAVTIADDSRIKGVVKNEDAFSLQLMTEQQQLRAFSKAELRQLTRLPDSLMPNFDQETLNGQELIDIIHFLDRP